MSGGYRSRTWGTKPLACGGQGSSVIGRDARDIVEAAYVAQQYRRLEASRSHKARRRAVTLPPLPWDTEDCPTCAGRGSLPPSSERPRPLVCPACEGAGKQK